jgi:hypothetical protein
VRSNYQYGRCNSCNDPSFQLDPPSCRPSAGVGADQRTPGAPPDRQSRDIGHWGVPSAGEGADQRTPGAPPDRHPRDIGYWSMSSAGVGADQRTPGAPAAAWPDQLDGGCLFRCEQVSVLLKSRGESPRIRDENVRSAQAARGGARGLVVPAMGRKSGSRTGTGDC